MPPFVGVGVGVAMRRARSKVPINESLPVISGSAWVGRQLSVTNGTWSNDPTSFTYQWNRNGSPIASANSSTYTLVAADAWALITCTVTASNGLTASATSAATSEIEYTTVVSGFEGANNGAVFTNESPQSITFSRTGTDIYTSTTQKKFGSSSLFFFTSGTTDRFTFGAASDANFAANEDFTIEAWIYPASLSATLYKAIFGRYLTNGDLMFWVRPTNVGGKLWATIRGGVFLEGSTAIVANAWQHVAISRQGDTLRIFLNGALEASATGWGAAIVNGGAFGVGTNGVNSDKFSGYIDEFRLSRGKARYTAAFTAPTAAFARP